MDEKNNYFDIQEEQTEIEKLIDEYKIESETVKYISIEKSILSKIRQNASKIRVYKKNNSNAETEIQKNIVLKKSEEMNKKNDELRNKFNYIKKEKTLISKSSKNQDKKNADSDEVNALELKTVTDVAKIASKVQNETLESIQRSLRIGHTSEDIAHETLNQLGKNKETIIQIDETLNNLDSNLQRANRDIKWFFRQLEGDKCCVFMFFMIVVGLLFVVFYTIYKKRQ